MADYHPLIARAVAGLEKNSGENRRTLYERARTALVAQLRGVVPALDESEITRERLALEEAIRKVEAEAARHAREMARPNVIKRAEIPRREDAARPEPRPARPPAPPRETAAPGVSEPPAPRPPAAPGRRSLSDEAMRGFRDVASDPNAVQQSRRVAGFDHPHELDEPLPQAPSTPQPERNALEEYGQLEPQVQSENLWALPLDGSQPGPVDFDHGVSPVAEPPEEELAPQPVPQRPRRQRSYSALIQVGLILIFVIGLGSAAYWQRANIAGLFASVASLVRAPATQPPPREAAPAQPKFTDRVGQPAPQSSALPVAQRVVLYEEDPNDSQGKRYIGTVLWRSEMKPGAPGRPPELAIRGDIDVPERKMTAVWSLRRNTDQSLPASHTIEIQFTLPPDSPTGGVQNVPGVLMKQAEQTRGVPLAGLAVKVTPGFFLIGLSALATDTQRNLQLLKDRAWFDIPIVYNNNRRAILAMEKGTPGEKVFAEAFAAWKE